MIIFLVNGLFLCRKVQKLLNIEDDKDCVTAENELGKGLKTIERKGRGGSQNDSSLVLILEFIKLKQNFFYI